MRQERGHFNLIHHDSGFKADIYLANQSEFYNWAFENRTQIELLNSKIYIAPIEFVIINKLDYYNQGKSEKHIQDIKGIISNSSNLIDWKIVQKEAKLRGIEKLLELFN